MSALGFLSLVLPMATNIITLMYLGMNFESSGTLDPEDWKRKWVLVFAYLQVVGTVFLFVLLMGSIISLLTSLIRTGFYRDLSTVEQKLLWAVLFIMVIFCVFSIMTSVFIILYLGPDWNRSNIDSNDWKRKWIIFFAWLSLCFQAILLLLIAFLPVIFISYQEKKLIDFY
jgi:hypothetical protein